MQRFKIGDKVMINPESVWYGYDEYHPKDTVGVVEDIFPLIPDYNIEVLWTGGGHGGCCDLREEDLLPYKETT